MKRSESELKLRPKKLKPNKRLLNLKRDWKSKRKKISLNSKKRLKPKSKSNKSKKKRSRKKKRLN